MEENELWNVEVNFIPSLKDKRLCFLWKELQNGRKWTVKCTYIEALISFEVLVTKGYVFF